MSQNKRQELEHARKILHNPEFFWNSGTLAGERGSIRRAEWVVEAARMAPGKKVLEVGCGTGFFSKIFLQRQVELHAIDISPELVAKAVERCPQGADFRVCDVEKLPFESHFFDAVVGIRVLHHLDMQASFSEISRVIKPCGVIAFCEPNMLNPQIAIQKNVPWIKKMMGDTPDETAFFKWSLRRFLEKQGYQDIQITPFDFLHPWIHPKLVVPVENFGVFLEKVPLLKEIAGSLKIFAKKTL